MVDVRFVRIDEIAASLFYYPLPVGEGNGEGGFCKHRTQTVLEPQALGEKYYSLFRMLNTSFFDII